MSYDHMSNDDIQNKIEEIGDLIWRYEEMKNKKTKQNAIGQLTLQLSELQTELELRKQFGRGLKRIVEDSRREEEKDKADREKLLSKIVSDIITDSPSKEERAEWLNDDDEDDSVPLPITSPAELEKMKVAKVINDPLIQSAADMAKTDKMMALLLGRSSSGGKRKSRRRKSRRKKSRKYKSKRRKSKRRGSKGSPLTKRKSRKRNLN